MSTATLEVTVDMALTEAAILLTAEHMLRVNAAKIAAHNAAIDKASEIISEWLANGRDESVLFDKLADAKVWTKELL